MKLITIGSSSAGNSYALVSEGGEILLLEAGVKMAEVKKAIGYRINDVVGCCVSHAHGDHAKYAAEYAKFGVKVFCNQDVADKKSFPYGTVKVITEGKTNRIGMFSVAPFAVAHDVPCMGFLVRHAEMGIFLFATDTYQVPLAITGVDHYLIEANYSDAILKQNTWNGKIHKAQADRIMLSHMSFDYTVKYLRDCGADKSHTITLCHLSERNSDPKEFKHIVESTLGVPTYIATKGLVVSLSKEIV